jgi:glycerophosphoryl diester phosphodiesterase
LNHVDVIAHRGSRLRAVDNSAAAIAAAERDGASWVEVDVRLTRDGVAVLSHDDEVGVLSIRSNDLDTLKSAHEGLATLEEGLAAAGGLGVNLEFKLSAESVERLLASLSVLDAFDGPTLFSSFSIDLLRAMHRSMPDRNYGVLTSPDHDPNGSLAVKLAVESGFDVALPHDQAIGAELVETAKDSGIDVIAWTVNDSDRMLELAGFGVSGIITDDPARAVRVLHG